MNQVKKNKKHGGNKKENNIAIIVILLIIGGLGYYYFFIYGKNRLEEESTPHFLGNGEWESGLRPGWRERAGHTFHFSAINKQTLDELPKYNRRITECDYGMRSPSEEAAPEYFGF